jgi:hypothetical protein
MTAGLATISDNLRITSGLPGIRERRTREEMHCMTRGPLLPVFHKVQVAAPTCIGVGERRPIGGGMDEAAIDALRR